MHATLHMTQQEEHLIQLVARRCAVLSLAVVLAVAAGFTRSNSFPTGSRADSSGRTSTEMPQDGTVVVPVLGATRVFAVLSGAQVTRTVATAATGDQGVNPSAAVTGFPPERDSPPAAGVPSRL